MSESTARHALPLIAPGQAQKEMSHNEALAALDLLAHAAVEAVGTNTPPATPVPGQCWIVGATPTGAWSGHAQALAGWTGGGWRFLGAREGMMAWIGGTGASVRYTGSGWSAGVVSGHTVRLDGEQVVGARRPAIADAAGGTTVDAEARAVLAAVLGALRGHGLIAN